MIWDIIPNGPIFNFFTNYFFELHTRSPKTACRRSILLCNIEYSILLCNIEYSILLCNIQYYWILLNIIEYYWILLNIIEYYWILLNIIEYYWILLNIIEYYWILLNIIEYSILHNNIDRLQAAERGSILPALPPRAPQVPKCAILKKLNSICIFVLFWPIESPPKVLSTNRVTGIYPV